MARSSEDSLMPSFQHFHQQAEQSSNKPKFSNEVLSLSGLLQYVDSAQKQNFEAVCRLQPLVKTYRDKIQETSQAMIQAESSLGGEDEVPPDYAAAFSKVKERFGSHLGALESWMNVLAQKKESDSAQAIAKVKQSGDQLGDALEGLTVPE